MDIMWEIIIFVVFLAQCYLNSLLLFECCWLNYLHKILWSLRSHKNYNALFDGTIQNEIVNLNMRIFLFGIGFHFKHLTAKWHLLCKWLLNLRIKDSSFENRVKRQSLCNWFICNDQTYLFTEKFTSLQLVGILHALLFSFEFAAFSVFQNYRKL